MPVGNIYKYFSGICGIHKRTCMHVCTYKCFNAYFPWTTFTFHVDYGRYKVRLFNTPLALILWNCLYCELFAVFSSAHAGWLPGRAVWRDVVSDPRWRNAPPHVSTEAAQEQSAPLQRIRHQGMWLGYNNSTPAELKPLCIVMRQNMGKGDKEGEGTSVCVWVWEREDAKELKKEAKNAKYNRNWLYQLVGDIVA